MVPGARTVHDERVTIEPRHKARAVTRVWR
jgi:hypothetical protein